MEENLDVFGAVPLSREQAAVVVAKIEPARKRRETGDEFRHHVRHAADRARMGRS